MTKGRWKVWWKRIPGGFVSLIGLVMATVGILFALPYFFGCHVADLGIDMMEAK